MRRVLLATLAGAVMLMTAPAWSLGVDGVGLIPMLPTGGDGYPVLEVGAEPASVDVRLRNRNNDPREARIYAVAARPSEDGGFTLAGAGSADWLGFDDEVVTLAPAEERTINFTVHPRRVPEDPGHVALVLETGTGSTVVTRAATVIRVASTGVLGSPIAPFIVAALLLVLLVLAHLGRKALERRRGELVAQPA